MIYNFPAATLLTEIRRTSTELKVCLSNYIQNGTIGCYDSDILLPYFTEMVRYLWMSLFMLISVDINFTQGPLITWALNCIVYCFMPVNDIVMIQSMWVTVCTNTYIQSMNNYHIVLNCSYHLCFIYPRFHTSPQIHHGLLVLQWQVWFMNGVVEMTDHSSFATAFNTHLFISQVI